MNLILEQIFPTKNAKKQVRLVHLCTQILAILILIFLSVVSTTTFIFVSIAILPTLIFMFLDRNHSSQFESATVSAFNFIGLLPYLVKLASNWNNVESYAINFLTDSKTWFIIYGSAIIGKLVYILFPMIISKWQIQNIKNQKLILFNRKNELCKLWGINNTTISTSKNVN
jgi:hypothetical protein